MKTFVVGAGLAVLLCTPLSAMATPSDVREYCARISGGSYRTEAFCIEREQAAYSRLASRDPVEQRILDYCNRISNSWGTLEYCIKGEEGAKARLGSR